MKKGTDKMKILLALVVFFALLCARAPVSAAYLSKERKPTLVSLEGRIIIEQRRAKNIRSNMVIRQEKHEEGKILIARPVKVDRRIFNIINTAGIKSVEDYAQWLSKNVIYKSDGGEDVWTAPETTLKEKSGDCEDLAFLNAAFLHVLGYEPKAMALLGRPGKANHAICIFKKDGYYYWFDNTKLKKSQESTIEEFTQYIFREYICVVFYEIDSNDKKQAALSEDTN